MFREPPGSPVKFAIMVAYFIISMTKIVQLYNKVNDFFKTNEMAGRRNLNTDEIALQETKLL